MGGDPKHTRSFDWPGELLARVAPSHPRAAYGLATALGASRTRLTGRWPSVAEVRTLLSHLTVPEGRRVAAGIGALHERNRVLVRCIQRQGIEPVRSMVSLSEALRALDGPCILGIFHAGAVHALGPALEQMASPVLAFRSGMLFHPGGSLEIQSTQGDERHRAAGLHRALLHLRGGGIVVLALDEVPGPSIGTCCLGRPLALAPGAFALARWTGAPIVPLTARWNGGRVHAAIGDPVGSADEAASWLERYLLESPTELTLGLLRKLLGVI